jgi:cell division protein FtsW (lipid II flippase)
VLAALSRAWHDKGVSENTEKSHPIAGIIAALVLAAITFLLVGALNDQGRALFALPFLVGWSLFALLAMGWVSRKGAASPH